MDFKPGDKVLGKIGRDWVPVTLVAPNGEHAWHCKSDKVPSMIITTDNLKPLKDPPK